MTHSDHVVENRDYWNDLAPRYAGSGRRNWAQDEPTWGIWNISEDALHLLPELEGRDALELGCGTAYVSAWLARRGARVVGLDNSPAQLATARSLQDEFGVHFPLIHGDAERVPLQDESFDFIVSEYGAAIWCDPYRWIPEAARLLRPGGELTFLGNGALLMLCVQDVEADGPAEDRLLRPYFGMHRFTWPDDAGVEFHLTFGDWIRLFRANGFVVEDLIEIQAPEDAEDGSLGYVGAEWSRKWPSEQVWKVRKV